MCKKKEFKRVVYCCEEPEKRIKEHIWIIPQKELYFRIIDDVLFIDCGKCFKDRMDAKFEDLIKEE